MATSFLQIHKVKSKEDFIKYSMPKSAYEDTLSYIQGLPYYQKYKFRKNGILAVHIYLRCDLTVDQKTKWLQANMQWVREIFSKESQIIANIAQQENNELINQICLIPIAPSGRVSYEYYCNSITKLRIIQSTYLDKMKFLFNMGRASSKVVKQSAKSGIYDMPLHPSTLLPMPSSKNYSDIKDFEKAMQAYITQMQIYYDRQIESAKENSNENLRVKNKYLKQENDKLQRYIQPYLHMLEQYGGMKKANQMLTSAQLIQYAVRYYQEEGDKETPEVIQKIFKDGQTYITNHNISL